jgi:hypothetical protein
MSDASIVVLGSFNPAIFQPRWLAANGFVSEREAAHAEKAKTIITPEFARVGFGWFDVEATRDRVFFGTTPEADTASPLRDLVAGVFALLRHSPIQRIGMNFTRHIWLPHGALVALSEELAPTERWRDVLGPASLRSVTVAAPLPGLSGSTRVTVEPSVRIEDGVFAAVNNDFEPADKSSADDAIRVLDEHWDDAFARSSQIFSSLRPA